jgi:hypothetical protein
MFRLSASLSGSAARGTADRRSVESFDWPAGSLRPMSDPSPRDALVFSLGRAIADGWLEQEPLGPLLHDALAEAREMLRTPADPPVLRRRHLNDRLLRHDEPDAELTELLRRLLEHDQ